MTVANHVIAASGVTGPILLILVLGTVFRRIGLIDAGFVAVGNRLVFIVALPCLLFLSTATRPLDESMNGPLVLFGMVITLASAGALWLLAPLLVARDRRGVFVQSGFRGNMAVVGLALSLNAYGDEVLAMASVYLALVVILYNLLAVVVLGGWSSAALGTLARSPIVIGVVAGLAWSATGQPFPAILDKSAGYFAQLTLPLALLCIGGSLEWSSFRANRRDVAWVSLFKLVVVPAAATLAAIGWGFRGVELGVLFLMLASPTAATSYVMARQMTAHGSLAAEAVATTTALSPFSIALGYLLLSFFQLV